MSKDAELLLKVLCTYGLRMNVKHLSERERETQLRVLTELEEEYGVAEIYRAIKDGMVRVWPFSDGRPFDANDLRSNILKARSMAHDVQRKGESRHQLLPREDA